MSEIIKCLTNPKCKNVMNCNKKIDCTTAMEQIEGLTRYICGRVPCDYSDKEVLKAIGRACLDNGIHMVINPISDDISDDKSAY